MNCWICESELIWGGDSEDEWAVDGLISNFSCNSCEAFVRFYHGGESLEPLNEI